MQTKKSQKRAPEHKALPLSETRKQLSPLVRQVSELPQVTVPIAVHGKVRAYLVSAERLEQLMVCEQQAHYGAPRAKLRGTLQVLGDLDQGSQEASAELERLALERFDRTTGKRSPR